MGNFLLSSGLEGSNYCIPVEMPGRLKTYDLKTGKLVWRGEPSERGTYLSPNYSKFYSEKNILLWQWKDPSSVWIPKRKDKMETSLENFS